jgi:hypothetical protein
MARSRHKMYPLKGGSLQRGDDGLVGVQEGNIEGLRSKEETYKKSSESGGPGSTAVGNIDKDALRSVTKARIQVGLV